MPDLAEVRALQFFDANCRLGPGTLTVAAAPITPAQLGEEMDRVGIAEALVYHSHAAQYAPGEGNAQLVNEIQGHRRLHGCCVALPHYTGELDAPSAWVSRM